MNEHQLKSEAYSLVLHKLKAKRDADYIRDSITRMAKAYAASEVAKAVAAKDAQLVLVEEIMQKLATEIVEKDAEIEALKAENSRWCVDYYKLKFELQTAEAENKRLRDGIEKEVRILRMLPLQNRTECLADLLLPNGNASKSLDSPAPKPKYVHVAFGSLAIGQEFECYGDQHLAYDYPKICKCRKTGEEEAFEIGSMYFLIHKSSMVMLPESQTSTTDPRK